jgi:LacI family transcriptional regulator
VRGDPPNLMSAPKLGDIAKRAGVSTAAASIALNNPDTNRVSAAKRAEILQIAEELGYAPNELAKALTARKTRLLGLMVPLKDPIFFNHFISQVLSGIQAMVTQRGYNLLIYSPTGKPGRFTRDQILESRFSDGLIFINTRSCLTRDVAETIRELDRAKITYTMVNSYYGRAAVNYVGFDDPALGEAAAEYITERGHRHIAFLSGSGDLPTHIHLLKGLRKGLAKAGLELPDSHIGCTGYDKARAFEILDGWFAEKRKRPSVVFCGDDQLLMHLYDYVELRGMSIPADLAVVGRGNIGVISMLRPRPTSFAIPAFEAGKLCAEMLIDSIERPETKKRRVLLPFSFYAGETA